jgi:D-xylose transport system substrate-binding protein
MRLKFLLPLGLTQERWHQDRKFFMDRAKEIGAEASFQVANYEQAADSIRYGSLRDRAVDVLVVVPSNDTFTPGVVQAARAQGVPVIAYDKLVEDCDLDLYLSFDNVEVGRLQANYLLKRAPQGDYILVGGPPEDANAKMYRRGQMEVLQPYLDRGAVRIVEDQAAKGWFPLEALRIVREALAKSPKDLRAVLASNDATAGGVIRALEGKNLAGQVLVSGQDADLAACQRIMAGTQSMTVYKPVKLLATKAAEVAVALAKKEPLGPGLTKVPNGKSEVPAILFKPVCVDKDNLRATVLADGFHSEDEVFKSP